MTKRKTSYRLPAEWEPVDAVLLAWPNADTDWASMLPEVHKTYIEIITAISHHARVVLIGPVLPSPDIFPPECEKDNLIMVEMPINDTWTRDYGPITLVDEKGDTLTQSFVFNGWGMKFAANHDNQAAIGLHSRGILAGGYSGAPSLILEGGAIESDGKGTILTTECCMLAPNRNDSLAQSTIEFEMMRQLRARKILWLQHGELAGDDTDGHIDTLARFIPPGDTIVYTGCNDPDDPHYLSLQAMARQLGTFTDANDLPYHLIELPLPDPIYDPEDGTRLPATYANFLIVNGAVLVPVYGQEMKDHLAVMTLRAAMPEYEIIPIDCRSLIRQHGSLHCATMQLPVGALNQDYDRKDY